MFHCLQKEKIRDTGRRRRIRGITEGAELHRSSFWKSMGKGGGGEAGEQIHTRKSISPLLYLSLHLQTPGPQLSIHSSKPTITTAEGNSPHAFHLDKKVEVFAAEGSQNHQQIH